MPRALAAGDGINQDETVEVAADGLGELRLNDETKLALGPGAKLKLDKFVYDPAKSSGTIAVDLTKGAFRFITGNARKPSYLIRSPNAAISVRGTIFDVYVDATGYMWILLHEGSIEVCNSRGQCSELTQACGLVRVGANGDISGAATWNRQPSIREIDFETAFPFVVRPPQIDPAPRYTRAAVEAGSCPSGDITPPKTRRADAEIPGEPASQQPERALNEPGDGPTRVTQVAADRPLPARDGAPVDGEISSAATPSGHTPSRPVAYDPAPDEAYPASDEVPAMADASPGRQSWSGFYIGLTGGGADLSGDVDPGCRNAGLSTPFPLIGPDDCAYARSRHLATSNFMPDPNGFAGGGVAGFNMQLGALVAGIETDMSWTSISGHAKTDRSILDTGFEDAKVTQDLNWLGTFRGRVGYAYGNWLLFATGGVAFGEVEMTFARAVPRTGDYAFDSETTTPSWLGTGSGRRVRTWSDVDQGRVHALRSRRGRSERARTARRRRNVRDRFRARVRNQRQHRACWTELSSELSTIAVGAAIAR